MPQPELFGFWPSRSWAAAIPVNWIASLIALAALTFGLALASAATAGVSPNGSSAPRHDYGRTYSPSPSDSRPLKEAASALTSGMQPSERSRPSDFLAAEGGGDAGRIVIGRLMVDRVIPYAERTGAEYYGGTPKALDWLPLRGKTWLNKRWLTGKIKAGFNIEDVGAPTTYHLDPSPFYDAEHDVLAKFGYPRYTRVDLGD